MWLLIRPHQPCCLIGLWLQDYNAVLAFSPHHASAWLNKAKVHVALKQMQVRSPGACLCTCACGCMLGEGEVRLWTRPGLTT